MLTEALMEAAPGRFVSLWWSMLVEANVVGMFAKQRTEILWVGYHVIFRPDERDVIRSIFSLFYCTSGILIVNSAM
jgi:hypothetical protein